MFRTLAVKLRTGYYARALSIVARYRLRVRKESREEEEEK